MTLYILPAGVALIASLIVYVFLFVGRRGRNFPDGKPCSQLGLNVGRRIYVVCTDSVLSRTANFAIDR